MADSPLSTQVTFRRATDSSEMGTRCVAPSTQEAVVIIQLMTFAVGFVAITFFSGRGTSRTDG